MAIEDNFSPYFAARAAEAKKWGILNSPKFPEFIAMGGGLLKNPDTGLLQMDCFTVADPPSLWDVLQACEPDLAEKMLDKGSLKRFQSENFQVAWREANNRIIRMNAQLVLAFALAGRTKELLSLDDPDGPIAPVGDHSPEQSFIAWLGEVYPTFAGRIQNGHELIYMNRAHQNKAGDLSPDVIWLNNDGALVTLRKDRVLHLLHHRGELHLLTLPPKGKRKGRLKVKKTSDTFLSRTEKEYPTLVGIISNWSEISNENLTSEAKVEYTLQCGHFNSITIKTFRSNARKDKLRCSECSVKHSRAEEKIAEGFRYGCRFSFSPESFSVKTQHTMAGSQLKMDITLLENNEPILYLEVNGPTHYGPVTRQWGAGVEAQAQFEAQKDRDARKALIAHNEGVPQVHVEWDSLLGTERKLTMFCDKEVPRLYHSAAAGTLPPFTFLGLTPPGAGNAELHIKARNYGNKKLV